MYQWLVVIVRNGMGVTVADYPTEQEAFACAAAIRFALKGLPVTAKVVVGNDDEIGQA